MEERTEGMERQWRREEQEWRERIGDKKNEGVQTNGEGEKGKEKEVDKENGLGLDEEVDSEGDKE